MAGSDSHRLCVKCKKIIQTTEAVLVCGLWCRKSFHKECLGLSNSDARAVTSSELLFKFHCEACEKRLGTELCGEKEHEQPKNVGQCVNNCVNLLDLVQKLVKLTTEVSNDNSAINSKLDIVLRTNAKLEEYLLQSPKGFEIRSEGTRDNSVVRVESDSPKRITEIREQYDGTNVSTQNINCDQMRWCASQIKRVGSDFPKQSVDSQHPCQQQNITEDCSPNCQQGREESDGHNSLKESRTIVKECQQGREESDGHNSLKESRTIVKEECPHPEDMGVICTLIEEKSEDEEDEQRAVLEAGMKRRSSSEAFVGPSKFRTEDSEDDEAEDAERDEFEGCPIPEDIGVICTLIEEKSEDEEDEQRALLEAGMKVKQEMEYTTSGSEQESSIPVVIGGSESGNDGHGLVPNISLAEKKERSIQHSTQKDAEACGNKPDRRDTEHRCFICKKMFVGLQELQDHFHLHSGTAILSCSVCHKTFKTKSNLKEHFRCHTGERPYRCTICNKTFSYNSSLKQHLMVHSADSPYKCSLCNKEFRLSLSLKQHMKLHTGECPYKCSICSKAFIRSSNLKQHLRVHTGERPYRCSICNKGYTLFSSMHRHFRKHSR